ncbi:hypothetical protein MTR67_007884 [Solanum verrucosum]|uniref:Uncharacterized protein n=1 Tax=Solanum verrucosum TaxID=315347 RepID=A0AAF0TDG7_SOLVR|nr:hypothetical protein MTR67_007884 [Solanum verrucosum]
MLGQTPQHPNKNTTGENKIAESSGMQRGSTLTLKCSTRSTANRMLALGTCVCIIIRCRPTGISTLNVRTQVPRINIQYAVDPAEHSRVSAELRKPGQGFAWGQKWSPGAGPA